MLLVFLFIEVILANLTDSKMFLLTVAGIRAHETAKRISVICFFLLVS